MNWMSSLSIKYKLLFLLIVVPLVAMTLFLFLTIGLFEKDKILYIYDSNLNLSKNLSVNVSHKLKQHRSLISMVMDGYDYKRKLFSENSLKILKNEKDVVSVFILSDRKVKAKALNKDSEYSNAPVTEVSLKLITGIVDEKPHLIPGMIEGFPNLYWFVLPIKFKARRNISLLHVATLLDLTETFKLFSSSYSINFLSDLNGKMIIGEITDEFTESEVSRLFGQVNENSSNKGIFETSVSDSGYLIAFSKIDGFGLSVVTLVNKSNALNAIKEIITKSILFFAGLISFSIIISIISSNKITRSLADLSHATEVISKGDFTIKLPVQTRDEVGTLARNFNKMGKEISRLMVEVADKARMENELATAKLVQETLFPPVNFSIGNVEVAAAFEAASECGGDWLFYEEINNRVFLIIADATGHGVPAALMTSAAKSASSVLSFTPDISVDMAISYINRALYDVSGKQVYMTFFIAALDKNTGEFAYSNASHEPPLLVAKKDGELSKQDLIPLNEVNGPRIGEDKTTKYEKYKMILNPGDTIFFYTDGISELKNSAGKDFGERKLVKTLISALSAGGSVVEQRDLINFELNKHRGNTPLNDDVTYFLCKYNG